MNKGQLYFLIGSARSGKSTIAHEWVNFRLDLVTGGCQLLRYNRKKGRNETPRVIVSGDDIRIALTGQRFCPEAEKMVNTTKYLMIKTLLLGGHDVLMDSTNTTEKSIMDILREDINAIPHWIDTPVEVCKQRAIDSNQTDLIEYNVIKRMHSNLDQLMFKYKCPDMNQLVEYIREDYEAWQ